MAERTTGDVLANAVQIGSGYAGSYSMTRGFARNLPGGRPLA